jgi:NADH dehydrogenase
MYGKGDAFVSMLAGMIRRLPVVPVVGEGRQRLQPIPVEQVAEAFQHALSRPDTIKQIYDVGGPDAVTMVELLDAIGYALGHRHVRKVHLPIALMRTLAAVLQTIPAFPLTTDQIAMLGEDNTCDPAPFFRAFNLTPVPLQAGLGRLFA